MASQQAVRKQPQAGGDTSQVLVHIYDGTRQLLPASHSVLINLTDGFTKRTQVEAAGPSIDVTGLPFYDNLGDEYSVVAVVNGFQQAGYQPVHLRPDLHPALNLMLLPKNRTFNFAAATWQKLGEQKPKVANLIKVGYSGDIAVFYGSLLESAPAKLACLLNITAALEGITLPAAGALDFFVAVEMLDLQVDRFYAWTRTGLLSALRDAAKIGLFQQQPAADLMLHSDPKHGPATSSYKQLEFTEANVQFTFHEGTRKVVGGNDCVLAEIDIDYYPNLLNHAVLEVIPNALTGSKTNPEMVYVLRWIAAQREGKPFNPLYTITAA